MGEGKSEWFKSCVNESKAPYFWEYEKVKWVGFGSLVIWIRRFWGMCLLYILNRLILQFISQNLSRQKDYDFFFWLGNPCIDYTPWN